VLVGVRDLDEAEIGFIDRNSVPCVKVGSALPEVLGRVAARRPAYVHIDCDALEPGLVLTDPRAAAATPAASEFVGISGSSSGRVTNVAVPVTGAPRAGPAELVSQQIRW